jgi:hypothetical protein
MAAKIDTNAELPLMLSPKHAGALLGVSERTMQRRAHEFGAVMVGGQKRIPLHVILSALAGQLRQDGRP